MTAPADRVPVTCKFVLDGLHERIHGGRDSGGETGAERTVGALHRVHHQVVRQESENPGQFDGLAESQPVRTRGPRPVAESGIEFEPVDAAGGTRMRVGRVDDHGERGAFPQPDQPAGVTVAGREHGVRRERPVVGPLPEPFDHGPAHAVVAPELVPDADDGEARTRPHTSHRAPASFDPTGAERPIAQGRSAWPRPGPHDRDRASRVLQEGQGGVSADHHPPGGLRGVGQGLGPGNSSTSARTSTATYFARHGRSASDSRATSWSSQTARSFSDTGKGDSAAPTGSAQVYAVRPGCLEGEAGRAARRVPGVDTHGHGIDVARCIRPREGPGYWHQRPGASGGQGRCGRAQECLGAHPRRAGRGRPVPRALAARSSGTGAPARLTARTVNDGCRAMSSATTWSATCW